MPSCFLVVPYDFIEQREKKKNKSQNNFVKMACLKPHPRARSPWLPWSGSPSHFFRSFCTCIREKHNRFALLPFDPWPPQGFFGSIFTCIQKKTQPFHSSAFWSLASSRMFENRAVDRYLGSIFRGDCAVSERRGGGMAGREGGARRAILWLLWLWWLLQLLWLLRPF